MQRSYSTSREKERENRSPYNRRRNSRDSKDHNSGEERREKEKRYLPENEKYFEKTRYRSRERDRGERDRKRYYSGSRSPRQFRKSSRENSAENSGKLKYLIY